MNSDEGYKLKMPQGHEHFSVSDKEKCPIF